MSSGVINHCHRQVTPIARKEDLYNQIGVEGEARVEEEVVEVMVEVVVEVVAEVVGQPRGLMEMLRIVHGRKRTNHATERWDMIRRWLGEVVRPLSYNEDLFDTCVFVNGYYLILRCWGRSR